ncbi:hypothetical protein BKA67DRAFT_653371 [Truncatella angustata]|uniref:Uncharacterized protein n=1 Tax=Truncatella angustata TaxID=152316 RepID=A0A9P9A4D0_9PEZI|nr:uncharacterized protein BKA67DRAFT_653371 [Truncatella angustata]KAH6660170.1 hypothetical protein BKA67DRAFT_653371 [Truncatella angustata]KAH8201033.1 hypothetical protein TruAng_004806 [Truncatella angustata]
MGQCCGKADSDNFQTPGRSLGSAPPQPERAPVPQSRKVGGPPRTLGGSGSASGQDAGGEAAADARRKAAEAAEARAKAAQKTTGKLSEQLQAQKRQTRQDTLNEASQNELRAREADQAAQARNYD